MKPLIILAGPTAVGRSHSRRKNGTVNKTCEKNKRRRYFRGFDAGI